DCKAERERQQAICDFLRREMIRIDSRSQALLGNAGLEALPRVRATTRSGASRPRVLKRSLGRRRKRGRQTTPLTTFSSLSPRRAFNTNSAAVSRNTFIARALPDAM